MSASLLEAPAGATACYVFAHGAGAGMNHSFMEALAGKLAERGIDGADHAFHVLVRSGRTDAQVLDELAGVMASWMSSRA